MRYSDRSLTDFESGGIESIILGIGINFSTAVSSFPENIQQKVDSLFHEKPAGITRNQIAAASSTMYCAYAIVQDRSLRNTKRAPLYWEKTLKLFKVQTLKKPQQLILMKMAVL